MASIKQRDASGYLSSQNSVAIGFGSPALSQSSGWSAPRSTQAPSQHYSRSVHSTSPALGERHYQTSNALPSPPQQHDSTFLPQATYHPSRGSPLSPPPSTDGMMTPPNNAQEFDGKLPMDSGLPEMWANLPETDYMKNGGRLDIMTSGAPSPPTHEFIEDILQEDTSHLNMGHGYMEDSAFNTHHHVGPVKRERPNPNYSMSAPYPVVEVGSGSGSTLPRKKRTLTGPNEANFNCKQCGKYFSRIWNYNAHQETHDPDRPRPHICPAQDCDKAFVRRTDLTRHTQCVHIKDKKFRCELCGNMFARKDTLRRHEDDGCPKRVDIVSKHSKNRPFNWSSQALSIYPGVPVRAPQAPQLRESEFYPPPRVASFEQQSMSIRAVQQPQAQYTPSEQIPPPQSGLPPLSDIVHRATW
ncbi:hypothetical protein EDC01DRAFT_652911 [Geopyxis carbonaria]|nr:hypothetical protein EDC01DRAFT_652911 [Geopyxis carbonaria]